MKTRLGFTAMLAAALFTALAVSCGGGGGKGKYGQVLAKKSEIGRASCRERVCRAV
jgi:hypothetical protein